MSQERSQGVFKAFVQTNSLVGFDLVRFGRFSRRFPDCTGGLQEGIVSQVCGSGGLYMLHGRIAKGLGFGRGGLQGRFAREASN